MFLKKKLQDSEWMDSRVMLNYWIMCLAFLTIGSVIPMSSVFHALFMIDAIVHFVLCVVITFISMILFRNRKTAFLISFAVTPYGYLLEFVHSMFSGDGFNAVNVLANNLGVLAGIATGFVLRLKNHYYREQSPGPEHDGNVHEQ